MLVENGAEGYSPTVSTGTSSDGSTTITVTNKDGSTTTELVDGTARKDAANAAKVATNYIHSDSTNGLVVNNNQTVGVGYDVQLKANGSDTGMNIRQDGNILASFLQDSVSLGKNSINSKVAMCGDKGGVSASFGYYVDSVTSNNAEPGSTLSFDFNETTFKNKVGQTTGFYEFTYTSADGWKLFDPVNDTSSTVTLSQYGITMRTPTSSLDDYARIAINYVLDGSVRFYNADTSNPVRKLELETAESPSSSESDYANITIERQSGTYTNGDGKEHSIITMMTLHEFANVATLQLFDDEISLNASRLYLTLSSGDGAIQLNGDVVVNGAIYATEGDTLIERGTSGIWTYEKWSSGKLVQYARTEYTGKLSTAQAGGYASAKLSIEDYPIAFIDNPVLTYGVYSSSDSASFVAVYPSATPTIGIGHYRLWRGNSQGTSHTYNVCFEAKGRWK